MPEIPLRLERQPDLGIPARQRLEQECRVGADATTGLDDGVESLERNVHAPGRFNLRDPERFKKLLQEHLARMCRWAMGGQHCSTSVVVSAAHVECVRAVESEDDSILIVHANRVPASSIARERVQTIPRWHFEVFEPGHGVDLVQPPPNDWPQLTWDASGGLRVDAVPDVPRRVVGQCANHTIAL